MSQRKKTLREIFSEHEGKVSDKWSLYIAEYERIFQEYRDKPIKLLEIGVQNGGSLEIWAKYFENGLLFLGCDVDSACALLRFDDPRIVLVIGDANADSTREQILSHSPEFDIVIDDGSHHSKDIIQFFVTYFPMVANGGLYIVEDLHASYWKEFGGGLFNPFSAVSFFKRLVDLINCEHWGIERTPSEILKGFQEVYGIVINNEMFQYIHSVEFANSLCIIRKSRPINNILGPRVVAGKKADVCSAVVSIHATQLEPPPQTSNPWSMRIRPLDEEVIELEQAIAQVQAQLQTERELLTQQLAEKEQLTQQLQARLAEREQTVEQLHAQLAQKEREVSALQAQLSESQARMSTLLNSKSWRLTAPLRRIYALGKQIFRKDDLHLIRHSHLFDARWYLQQNPDVAQAGIDPALHYLHQGWREGRDPSPRFSSKWYSDTYEGVRKAGINPLVYYLRYGRKEKRSIKPSESYVKRKD